MVMLTLIATGCATDQISIEALKETLDPLAKKHAAALATDGGAQSVSSGRDLISTYDCIVEPDRCPE